MRKVRRRYIQGWQGIVARLRPALPEVDPEMKMHALFGVLNPTQYNTKLDGATDERVVLVDTALAAVLGSAP